MMNPYESPAFNKPVSASVDQSVGAASISPCGRDLVLASRKGLIVVDLDNPYDPPRTLQHLTAWEVADVQWSPHASRDYWVVSTSNQKAMLWNLNLPSSRAIEHVLHGHDRAITDINFNAHHPDILATCSVDTFVHVWDIRDPSRPVNTFGEFRAGATQVKWNRQDQHILASSHDRFLHVWDDRKGSIPIRTIQAHDTKIYGIDWNRTRISGILTCSLDRTVKFWDYMDHNDTPERTIATEFPVWRARHTPFGWGCMTMPQRGGNNALHLFDRRAEGFTQPKAVETFAGHTDQVKEFLFRSRGGEDPSVDDREFQMVTWSKDHDIRLWPIQRSTLVAVGHDREKPIRFRMTRRGAEYKTYRNEPLPQKGQARPRGRLLSTPTALQPAHRKPLPAWSSATGRHEGQSYMTRKSRGFAVDTNPLSWMKGIRMGKSLTGITDTWSGPENLGEELSIVAQKFPRVKFEKIDVAERTCTLALHGPWGQDSKIVFLRVLMRFPSMYPFRSSPEIEIEKTNLVPDALLEEMTQSLKRLTSLYMEHKRACVEPCLRYLLGEKVDDVEYGYDDHSSSSSDEDEIAGDTKSRKIVDDMQNAVPLAKACGAVFAPNGKLVCFFPAMRSDITKSGLLKDERQPLGYQRFFETFGRLYTPSAPFDKGKPSAPSAQALDNSDSESASSTSSDDLFIKRGAAWPFDVNGLHRVGGMRKRSADHSDRTSQSHMANSRTSKARYFVSIHSLTHLLPAREDLAAEYAIFGDGVEICRHNTRVARSHGCTDIGDVWQLAELILTKNVPLQILEGGGATTSNEPVLVVAAKKASAALQRRASGMGMCSFDQYPSEYMGKVKFGYHVLGGQWLIDEIFHFFERRSDPQMLAMLACVFCEPDRSSATSTAYTRLSQPDMPMAMKSPGYSLDYYSSADQFHIQNHTSYYCTSPQTPASVHTPFSIPPAYMAFLRGDTASDSFQKHLASAGATPPTPGGFRTPDHLGASPERLHVRRPTGQSQSSRPGSVHPSPPQSKKQSPPSSLQAGNLGVSWSQSVGMAPNSASSAGISSSYDAEPVIKVTLTNMADFDDDKSVASRPLLNPSKAAMYRHYREYYADLLYSWGFLQQRLEVLKFNSLNKVEQQILTKRKIPPKLVLQSLSFGVRCFECGVINPQDQTHCEDCGMRTSLPQCSLCNCLVKRLISTCISCEHAGHPKCLEEWFSSGEQDCPTGCGCQCVLHVSNPDVSVLDASS